MDRKTIFIKCVPRFCYGQNTKGLKKMDEQTEVEEKKLTAKKISKAFKFIAPAGAIICAVLLWVGVFTNATIGEICALWATVYGLGAGTIDANIIIDKYTGGKN